MPEFLRWLADNWALVVMGVGALGFLVVKVWPVVRKFVHLIDDLTGEPDRPGVPGRPGVMDRLAQVEHELKPNSGTTIKDAVNRIDSRTELLGQRLDAVERVVAPDQPRRSRRR